MGTTSLFQAPARFSPLFICLSHSSRQDDIMMPMSKIDAGLYRARLTGIFRKIAADAQRRTASGARLCVLATGGLDSSLLASLLKPLRPHLYFALVRDESLRSYNARSMRRCRALARGLGLQFSAITVTKRDYVKAYISLRPALPLVARERDIAAVAVFFRSIAQRQKHPCFLLSGMGVNELCSLSARGARAYYRKKALAEIRVHQKLARAYGLSFRAPWLSSDSVRFFTSLPAGLKTDKAFFKKVIAGAALLPPDFIRQPSCHSSIPSSFLKGLDG